MSLGTPWHVAYPSVQSVDAPAVQEPYLQQARFMQPMTQSHGTHLASAAARARLQAAEPAGESTCHACHGKLGDVQVIVQFLVGLLLLLLIDGRR